MIEVLQRQIRPNSPPLQFGTLLPQESDHELVLLAKMAAGASGSRQQSGLILDQTGQALQVQKAIANVAASQTDSVIVPALDGYVVRVLSLKMQAGGTATGITFGSKVGAAATQAVSPLFANPANVSTVLPMDVHGHFKDTESNGALVATTGAGAATGIMVSFVYVPDNHLTWTGGDSITWNDGTLIE